MPSAKMNPKVFELVVMLIRTMLIRTMPAPMWSELHASPHIHIWSRRSIYGYIWIRQYGNVL